MITDDSAELAQTEEELRLVNAELHEKVRERSAEMARLHEQLRAAVARHRKAERELQLFRALVDRSNDSMEVVDADTARVLDVNERACQTHGYTRQEYLSLRIADLDPTMSEKAAWDKNIEQLRKAGSLTHHGLHRRKDGSLFPVEVRASCVRLDREYMVAVVRDVSGRKQAEEDLRRTAELLRAVADGTTDAVFVKDRNGKYLLFNEAAARFVGKPVSEVLGKDDTALFDPASARAVMARDRQIMEAGRVETAEEMLTAAGVTRVYQATKAPYRDEAGNVIGLVGISRDITDRKRTEEALRVVENQFRQAQKMEAVGRLAGGVAHDFNNLLTVIIGFTNILLSEIPATDHHRDALAAILDAGERAARLTGQLLAFSRKAIVEPKVLDLNELIDNTGKLLRRLIGEDVRLTTILSPALGRVKVDPGQVEQVVLNLAVNARDAMPQGGSLTIETANVDLRRGELPDWPDLEPGRHVRMTVSDTGCGMTEEVKARIFEPFFTTKGAGKGTGLGLATVYGIVKQANGHIVATSRVGSGTSFTVLLPVVTEAAAPAMPEEVRLAPRGTETILLAEDEDGVRRLVRLALQTQGYVVLDAGSGSEAVRAAEGHPAPIHLLLTDVVMPDLGGRKLAEAVRARRPDVKVLYMSGYTDDSVVRHGVPQEADAFLQKPFTPLMLVRKVRAVLDDRI